MIPDGIRPESTLRLWVDGETTPRDSVVPFSTNNYYSFTIQNLVEYTIAISINNNTKEQLTSVLTCARDVMMTSSVNSYIHRHE